MRFVYILLCNNEDIYDACKDNKSDQLKNMNNLPKILTNCQI